MSTRTNTVSHRVAQGETLTSIANSTGTSVKFLAEKNHIKNPNKIMVGQTLDIGGAQVASRKLTSLSPPTQRFHAPVWQPRLNPSAGVNRTMPERPNSTEYLYGMSPELRLSLNDPAFAPPGHNLKQDPPTSPKAANIASPAPVHSFAAKYQNGEHVSVSYTVSLPAINSYGDNVFYRYGVEGTGTITGLDATTGSYHIAFDRLKVDLKSRDRRCADNLSTWEPVSTSDAAYQQLHDRPVKGGFITSDRESADAAATRRRDYEAKPWYKKIL